ncbi:MAG: MGMT family protein [Deltaproteobacteria bacterium]|nr:MGMT family protein [Deltaproteobacteria bacterium]
MKRASASRSAIYAAVRRIPIGRVCSYGRVARAAGLPGQARQVGYALAALDDLDVPWHRVVASDGRITLPGEAGDRQRALLRAEGIEVIDGRVELRRFLFEEASLPG